MPEPKPIELADLEHGVKIAGDVVAWYARRWARNSQRLKVTIYLLRRAASEINEELRRRAAVDYLGRKAAAAAAADAKPPAA